MKRHPNGLFVVFEGIDRCGKLTQLHKARDWLEEVYPDRFIAFFSEPNDQSSPIGRRIRQILKHELKSPNNPLEFQRMFVIDRAQNIFCFLEPLLENGAIVLVERYAHSTLAFGMLDCPLDNLVELHEQVIGPNMIWPDLAFIFDISPEGALKRLAASQDAPQYFERKEKLERVRRNYLEISKRKDLGRMVIVNAERTPEEIFEEVKKLLLPIINSPEKRPVV